MTPDRALIYSILNGGLKAYNTAKRKGISSKDLFGDDILVFKLIEDMAPKGRVPSLEEVAQFAGVKLSSLTDTIDPEIASEIIARRTLIKDLNNGLGPLFDLVPKSPEEARARLIELLKTTAPRHGGVSYTNAASTIDEAVDRYLQAEARPEGLLGLSSPWTSLDKASLGMQKGELHILFAKRKVGKTFGSLAWVEHIWSQDLKPGQSILVVSMEMPTWQINRRLFAIKNKLDYAKFRAGKLDLDQRTRFLEWCQEMKKPDESRPQIVVVGADTVKSVHDVATLTAQHRPELVFVDAFYILNKESKKPKWERTLECAESLKLDIAASLDVPVLASSQLSGSTGKEELDADSDAAAFAKGIGDYADASYGLFADITLKEQQRRVFRVMDAREFVPINLLINFNQKTQDYSEIKRMDEEKNVKGGGFDDLPDFEEGEQLKFGD